jgi:chromosome segregation ATPase
MNANVFRIPASHQSRRSARSVAQEQSFVQRLQDRREKLTNRIDVLHELIEDRDNLREQLQHVRDLADRVISRAEAQQDRIISLEGQLKAKDALIADLEDENTALLKHVSAREDRINALEHFLAMISEAEERA